MNGSMCQSMCMQNTCNKKKFSAENFYMQFIESNFRLIARKIFPWTPSDCSPTATVSF